MKRIGAVAPLLFVLAALLGVPRGRAPSAARQASAAPSDGPASNPVHLAVTPNDQLFYRQWALAAMQVPYAWEFTKGSSSVVVAVIDSGVDATHPDLAGRVLPIGCNLVADAVCPADGRGTPAADDFGHGTEVAGIIGASPDNQAGIAGVAWNVSILPVRVTDGLHFKESTLDLGIRWAADHGANVISISAAEDCGTPESSELKSTLAYANSRGALLVAAAGNEGGCSQGDYPAADPLVLSVASTGLDDRPAADSNFGPTVRVAAPGQGIQTTAPGNTYKNSSGTSFAAPQVSGVAALLFSVPGATNVSVRNWILSTCDVPTGWNSAYGCGRINAYRAVALATTGKDPHTSPTTPVREHLVAGLNNVLYVGATETVDTALAQINDTFTAVYAWDPQRSTWETYLPGKPSATDLTILQERSAYWIYMRADADLTMRPSGNDPPPRLTLPAGWNNLSLPAGLLPAALQAFSAPVKAVYAWNAGALGWNGFFPDGPAASDLTSVQADAAYWVYAPQQLVVTYHR